MMPKQDTEIVITGYGAISAYGCNGGDGAEQLIQNVKKKVSAYGELTLFEIKNNFQYVAEIDELDYQKHIFSTQPYLDRTTAAALIAARSALDNSLNESRIKDNKASRFGISYASYWGATNSIEKFSTPINAGKPRLSQGLVFVHSFINSAASMIAQEFNLQGFSTVSSGSHQCSAIAIKDAISAITSGRVDAMLVGASDTINELTYNHQINNNYFTKDEISNQTHFLGEGSAFIVLENKTKVDCRNGKYLALINSIEKKIISQNQVDETKKRISLYGDCFSANPFFEIICAISGKQEEIVIAPKSHSCNLGITMKVL